MVRVYKSVRLAYEAKVWIDELIQNKERKIKELNQNNFLKYTRTNTSIKSLR